MSHDKIRAAAVARMAETSEPYAAARRAVLAAHQSEAKADAKADDSQDPSPAASHQLQMSGEIRDWLAGLRDNNPVAAVTVGQALAALLHEGARLGEPLVVSTADSWATALIAGLDRSYQERLTRLTALRRGWADAAGLATDLRQQAAELVAAQAKLEDLHRRGLDEGRVQEAAQAASALASARQQLAEVRRLLSRAAQATRRLDEEGQRLEAATAAFRTRKEILKASYTAAHYSLLIHEATEPAAASPVEGTTGGTAEARLRRDVTDDMERELGQENWPEGLMELRPAGPDDGCPRILFAVEPSGTVLLISVLDGPEAIRDHYLEAILLSAARLRQWRAAQAPEAAIHGYDSTRRFLEEFYPGGAGDPRA
jgi:hypothetical protein